MRVAVIIAEFSATAFISRGMPTTSGSHDCREGIISAKIAPLTKALMIRCSTRSMPNSKSTPTASASTALSVCPTCTTSRLEYRSATTPPNIVRKSPGIAFASITVPSTANEPVSWKARKPRTIICMFIAPNEPIEASMNQRNAGTSRTESKVRRAKLPPRFGGSPTGADCVRGLASSDAGRRSRVIAAPAGSRSVGVLSVSAFSVSGAVSP